MTDERAGALGGSFRDPSGFVFTWRGGIYRQVNRVFSDRFDAFVSSGLYQELVTAGLLIPHADMGDSVPSPHPDICSRIIQPEPIEFISYPYEWSFSQLKDAALATLEIQKRCLERDFTLKDCSAYNIQFHKGRPVFIDTLSFEPYDEGEPWVAYRQFCQHFLAPLALMARRDIRLSTLLRSFIDGVPLDLCSSLLPRRTRFSVGLLTHIHFHADSQKRFASRTSVRRRKVSRLALRGLIDSLETTVRKLRWRPGGTEWGEYYDGTNYSDEAMRDKHGLVSRFLERVSPGTVWDLGANTGVFSRIASDAGAFTVAFDVDPAAVEKNYRAVVEKKETRILPLVMDLTNPSSGAGWAHAERDSLVARGPADVAMGLALVHHLAISNNLPLRNISAFFASISRYAIIEFVPKSDSQVRVLLATREDIFPDYTEEGFREAITHDFEIMDEVRVQNSNRTLFLLRSTARLGHPDHGANA